MVTTKIWLAGLALALLLPMTASAQSATPGAVLKDYDTCPELVVLSPGTFIMGGREEKSVNLSDPEELPAHQVTIATGFALGTAEVTQAEWAAVMGHHTSVYEGPTNPVETVSWDDVQDFLARLSAKTGKQYRLPSEAEWEYGARAGSTSLWWFGSDDKQLKDYGWYADNSGRQTHLVKQKKPNPFGLYDMYGNVWEWVADCYHPNYEGAPTDGKAWTAGTCQKRVIRGGSWRSDDDDATSIERGGALPTKRSPIVGFRVLRSLTP